MVLCIHSGEKRMPKSKTDSLSSAKSDDSRESVGYQGQLPPVPPVDPANVPQYVSIRKLEAEGGAPMDEYIYNCIGFVIHCPAHNRVVLTSNERAKAVWLPFIATPQNKTWSDATMEGISIVFSKEDTEFDARLVTIIPIRSIKCLHILRIQLPKTKKFVTRLIQLITLGDSTETFNCCQNTKRLQWVPLNHAVSGTIQDLWGPEVPMYCSFIMEQKQQEILEYGLDQAFYYKTGNNPKNPEEEMILPLKLNKKDWKNIYNEFLEHCFPSFFMTYWSFCSYLQDYIKGLDENTDVSLHLFQAFNFNKNGYLGFHEFILGLAAIDPNCPNCESRRRFIFRYYDSDQDGILNRSEMSRFLKDISFPVADSDLLMNSLEQTPISWKIFSGLMKKDFAKIDSLCRSSKSLLGQISSDFAERYETRIKNSKRSKKFSSGTKVKGPCLACRERKYEYASHCVRFDQMGRCIEPRHILDEEQITDAISNGAEITMYQYSQEYVFSSVSIGHSFLDMIREFNAQSNQDKIGFFHNTESHEIFIKYIHILCRNVRSLLECQEKVLKLNSAVYVIGDIAGDLQNLLVMEQALWNSVPVLSNTFLFLGNYVTDNGSGWGIECVLYLFALKVVSPNKFYLLRGNNEIRHPDRFQAECFAKYGDKNGQIIYEIINEVFDRMSLVAIIDESIFCANCGVPESIYTISDIANITPVSLSDPLNNILSKDILTNTKCDEERILGFLKKNQLTHLIRGNCPTNKGYKVHFDGRSIHVYTKPITINDEITFLCVDMGKIRIVKIDLNVS